MTKVNKAPLDEKAKLQKQLDEYNQFQWLALMPVWLPGILNAINRTPITPGREIYVLLFRVGFILLGIIAFVAMRVKIGKLKAQLA
jgi:hypothetical protein